MDGIPIHVEAMSRDELITKVRELLQWSLSVGYYPGKIDHPKFKLLEILNAESNVRMSAE